MNITTAKDKAIPIGVSSCLLGEHVRYDGGHKKHGLITDRLCQCFSCIPICPEVGIGLGVPRQPIHVVSQGDSLKALGVEDATLDVTERLQQYAADIYRRYPMLRGFIVKSRSPSCGLTSVPIFDQSGGIQDLGAGIFSAALRKFYKAMPILEEESLHTRAAVDRFINEVIRFAHDGEKGV